MGDRDEYNPEALEDGEEAADELQVCTPFLPPCAAHCRAFAAAAVRQHVAHPPSARIPPSERRAAV